MVIGTGIITLRIGGARSLKNKRRVLKSILTRIHNRYNVAVAEVGCQEKHQEAEVGIACVSNNGGHASQILAAVIKFIEVQNEIEIISYHTELL